MNDARKVKDFFSNVKILTVGLSFFPANHSAVDGVYATFFTKDMPARICYQVSKLPMGAKVEIDAVAVK